MKRCYRILSMLLTAVLLVPYTGIPAYAENDDMNMYEHSDFIEKEQPELNDETKKLISLYQRDPSMENYLNLRDMVIENYNAVLARKEEKLASLKEETAGISAEDFVKEYLRS